MIYYISTKIVAKDAKGSGEVGMETLSRMETLSIICGVLFQCHMTKRVGAMFIWSINSYHLSRIICSCSYSISFLPFISYFHRLSDGIYCHQRLTRHLAFPSFLITVVRLYYPQGCNTSIISYSSLHTLLLLPSSPFPGFSRYLHLRSP